LFTQLNYFSSVKRPEYPVLYFCPYRWIIFSNYPLKGAGIAEGAFKMKKIIFVLTPIILLTIVMAACDNGSKSIETINWETDNNGWIQVYTNDSQYYNSSWSRIYDFSQTNSWEIVCKKISGYRNIGFGMIFAASDASHYYRFLITIGGSYVVSKRDGDEWTTMLDWANSTKINSGYNKENTLKVTKSGSSYSIYINGEQVNQFTDSASFGNKIGLFASTGSVEQEDFPNTPVDIRFKVK
jgi:hypothetical protein